MSNSHFATNDNDRAAKLDVTTRTLQFGLHQERCVPSRPRHNAVAITHLYASSAIVVPCSQLVESHSTTAVFPSARGVPIELRRPSTSFAAPLACWVNEESRLQGAPEARLVEASGENRFIGLLQLRQRELTGQQGKRQWRLFQAATNDAKRSCYHLAMSFGEPRNRFDVHPLPGRCRL